MGPGEACVVLHLSWVAVPRHRRLFTALRRRLLMKSPCISPFRANSVSQIFCRIPCSWFLFKMVMIILFCNINGSTFGLEEGGAEAFAIHIPLHDYIKSMFCHIWLMYRVFRKTGLKYENRQKLLHYKEWSIFNNLLKGAGGSVCCSERRRSGFCNIL